MASSEELHENNTTNNSIWQIDKKVPIAVIIMLMLQLITLVWYASQLTSKVEQNTVAIVELKTMVKENKAEHTTKLTELTKQLTYSTDRFNDKLDNLKTEIYKRRIEK